MDTIKDTDLTHIQVGGRKYNTGFSRNNYDDDEKNLVHGAAQKADTAKEFGLVRSEMIEKERKLQESIDAERTARTAADTALGSRIDTLNASVTSNKEQTDKSIIGLRSDLEQLGSDLGADVADKVSSAAFSEEVKRQNAAHAAISDDIKKVEGTNTEQDRRIEKNETDVTALGQRVDKEAERITKTDTSVKALDMRVSEAEKNSGSNVYEQNAILTKGNLIKEVEFGKLVLDNGNLQPNSNFGYSKFVNVAGMSKIKISTSWTGMTKGCFYKTKDISSKVESITISGGAVYDKEVVVPNGANFVQVSFSREDLVNGVALIQEVGSTNIEGVLPRVKSFVPLSVSRTIKDKYMNVDGGESTFTNYAINIYDVKNIEDVFLDGGSNVNNKTVSYVWVKNAKGQIIWKFDNINNQNKFNKFHMYLPEEAAELWVLFTIKVLSAKEQSEINSEFSEQLDTVKKENETLKQSIALTDSSVNVLKGDIKKEHDTLKQGIALTDSSVNALKERVKTLEDATPSTPTPTPQPTTNSLNHWKGKKIVWLGSSVPAGQTSESNPDLIIPDDGGEVHFLKRPYPAQIAEKLECTVINNCHSGMAVVANKVAEGVYHPLKYGSFCLSKAEYKAVNQERSGKYTYEDSLISPECRDADLYVLEFEINNLGLDKGKTAYESIIPKFNFGSWRYVDGSSFESHRETYQGAILFLLNKLFEFNPTAKIVFVNEFFSASASKWGVEFMPQTLTRQLAEKLNAPYIELSKILQYNAVNRWKYMFSENDMHIRAAVHDRIADILTHKFLEIA